MTDSRICELVRNYYVKNLRLYGVSVKGWSNDFAEKFNRFFRLTSRYSSVLLGNGWRRIFWKYSIHDERELILPPEEIYEYDNLFPSFDCYECSESGEIVPYCNTAYFSSNPKEQSKIVSKSLARQRAKKDWWFNRMEGIYTSYKFDYLALGGYKKSPRFWRSPGKKECYGHEFEISFPSFVHKLEFANEVKESLKPFICEKDGSLDEGSSNGPSLEVITNPLTFTESLTKIKTLFRLIARYQGFIPNDYYGWHCTVNGMSARLPDKAMGRLLYIINKPSLLAAWRKIGRRDTSLHPVKDYSKFTPLNDDEIDYSMWRDRHTQKPIDHFYAAFLRRPGDSIELRFCKSTVDFNVFCATLELVRHVWRFCASGQDLNVLEKDILNHVCNHS